MDFTPIETQEAFDNAIKSRLERNTKTVTEEVTKKFEGYISPDDFDSRTAEMTKKINTLSDKLKEKDNSIADLTAKNKAYETASVKARIAGEFNIPSELAGRLSGETEEEIRKDAEIMSKYTSGGHMPRFNGNEPPDKNTKTAALKGLLHDLNGGN